MAAVVCHSRPLVVLALAYIVMVVYTQCALISLWWCVVVLTVSDTPHVVVYVTPWHNVLVYDPQDLASFGCNSMLGTNTIVTPPECVVMVGLVVV